MGIKKCNKCGEIRNFSEYNKDCSKKDGHRNICKLCVKEKYLQNRDYEIQRSKDYQEKNREKVLKQKLIHAKKYFIKNHDKIKEYQKNYKKNRLKNDPLFRLSINISSRIRGYLKINNITKKNTTFDIVGCNPHELKTHLEKNFIGNMSWENYGEWHIDHIIPLSSASNEEELYKLCHFTNLQPLWAEDNLKKGNKLIYG
jgi:hypothetical protein